MPELDIDLVLVGDCSEGMSNSFDQLLQLLSSSLPPCMVPDELCESG